VENLFDKEYQEILGFPAPGIGAYGGVEATF
jgi:outer membrane cobalamin receptor